MICYGDGDDDADDGDDGGAADGNDDDDDDDDVLDTGLSLGDDEDLALKLLSQ